MEIAVESSALQSVAYRQRQLDITFESGHVYRYYGVPRMVYAGLLSADSKGRYFHDHIRDRYRFRRIA